MNIDKLIRKLAAEMGLEVVKLTLGRYRVEMLLSIDGELVQCTQFESTEIRPDRLNESGLRALLRRDIEATRESLISEWHFSRIRERDPELTFLTLGRACPLCAGAHVSSTDFSSWKFSCNGNAGRVDHSMPAHVWDGRRVRIRHCPEDHPIDCDCEGAVA